MSSLADKAILSGADNRPPMLEKDMYDSWRSRMELYMLNRQHGRMILESVEHGPLLWPTVEEDGVTRLKKYSELSVAEAIQADCDVKETNIILQALPSEIYALVSTHKVAKDLWEQIQMHMQGTSLTKQERECKLYDAFDKFAYQKGETLHDFYLRFSLLLNDMHMYNMKLKQFQVNTKFLNTLPPEWSKFVTDVKLVRDLHTTNVDQLHAYLGQHEYHANEFVSQRPSSSTRIISYPVTDTSSLVNHNAYMASSSAPQIDYALMVQQSSEYSPPEDGLVVLSSTLTHTNTEIESDSNIIPYSQYLNENQSDTVQISTSPALQDDLILSVIEQLKTQVVTCTKINHDNKQVNDLLTAELERYKRQERVLNESNHDEKASTTYEHTQEIDSLKHTLSEYLREKESFEKKISILKDDLQKEESRNIDRELALEKQEKVLVITALKEQLRKLKGKA
nr:hypothetical protein [Tanacetum cinerariifolium]